MYRRRDSVELPNYSGTASDRSLIVQAFYVLCAAVVFVVTMNLSQLVMEATLLFVQLPCAHNLRDP